jgi:uncharacterized membrane protein
MRQGRTGRGRTRAAFAAVVGIAAVILYSAVTRTRKEKRMELTAVATIRKSPQEVYSYWRPLVHLPDFMAHLDEVHAVDDKTSRWRATAPFGKTVEWDAVITEDVPGERIAWQSSDGADVVNRGTVEFVPAPGRQGTEIHVSLAYEVPGGGLGKALARFFGEEPRQQLDDDLRRLKQVLETGEVVRSEGAPRGKLARGEFPQRPAQPLSPEELAEIRQEAPVA